jgi:uncharacterized protein with HEPN domain
MNYSDYEILQKIGTFCYAIINLVSRCNGKVKIIFKNFENHMLFSMYLMQIGKQCANLSTEFKNKYTKINWNDLIDISNIIFNDVLFVDPLYLKKIANKNIPKLSKVVANNLSDKIYNFKSPEKES